ncbi:hypothetical protein [Magnetospira sp. QH-2]|uniref:hypothetical protein n=1 Tax=Magnetospira sp. (strain QH-2) TaxID=1288970 RepID=UPI0003E819EB|nr:hypothetical protein [Magnetospira sp. QH-2]CCQ72600.1 protein of unknown function [Magnetospira sp. QH-2]
MKYITWLLTLAVTALAVAFVASNPGDIAIDLWPLPFMGDVPLYYLPMGGLVLGFVVGTFVAWSSAGTTRAKARHRAWQLEDASRQMAIARNKIASLEGDLRNKEEELSDLRREQNPHNHLALEGPSSDAA